MKKKDEVIPVSETSEEEEDEEEEEIEVEETDSEYELTESAQQLEKPTKRVTKKGPKSEPLKKAKNEKTESKTTETNRKRKLNLDNKDQSKKTKKGTKDYPTFTNSDCDSDYTGDGIKNLTYHKAKITSTINMICHVFDGSKIKNYQGSEFAAITFQKKTKDDKSYELTIPLERGFNVIKAVYRFAELNPAIFKDQHIPICYRCKKN